MRIIRGMVHRMSKNIMTYSAGSIFGRAVYKSNKSVSHSNSTSIFGSRVYKDQSGSKASSCGSQLKDFLK